MEKELKITFTNVRGIPEEYEPKPASKYIPDWYKNLESYLNGIKEPSGQGTTNGTIKKCMPVFDSLTSGYIIPIPADVWVRQIKVDEESESLTQASYEWASFGLIEFHPILQAPNHPSNNGHDFNIPKWINPWSIKTPPGYSTMFVQPWHRESVFDILPGIVDTDTYDGPVNFPFILKNPNSFTGLIPAGTPMVQAIPFKRNSWQMEIGTSDDFERQQKTVTFLRTKMFDSYKNHFRQKKEYK